MNERAIPGSDALAELSEALGEADAIALATRFGGTRLYVPKSIGDNHPICAALGRATADRLADWAGGGSIDVPKQAAKRLRVQNLRSRGALTIAQIALETSYSERHVYRILQEQADDRQGSLFD
ncbi:MAG: hypothetical protein R3D89_06740 [Sphingomonadaceae bacterium]|jgi:hypothetical protein